jgi:hypothetical protein
MSDAAPTTANRTLRRLPNGAYRSREYLTEKEVERLIEAALPCASAHAEAFDWLQACQSGSRYEIAGAFWASEFAINGEVYGAGARSVCEVLARLEYQ